MIDHRDIVFNQRIYYCPQLGSSANVAVLKIFPDGCLLVDPSTETRRRKFFSIDPEFLFTDQREADRHYYQWAANRNAYLRAKHREMAKLNRQRRKKKRARR